MRPTIEAGKYNRRITIEEGIVSEDAQGGGETVWVKFADVWAAIEPMDADDPYYMDQINGRVNVNIYIRYLTGLRRDWRVIYNSQIYSLVEFYDVDAKHRELRLICKTLSSLQNPGTINKPAITSPANNATGISLTPTITSSAFTISAGDDTHRATHWQITLATDTLFATPVIDAFSTVDKTSLILPAGKLAFETEYIVRVSYSGRLFDASPWSVSSKFTTIPDPEGE
jgi:SPP1 family predicted phage head-tail adaptor